MIFRQWWKLGKYQNKDFRIWEWAVDFRCLGYWWTYPLLCFFDLGLAINAIIRKVVYAINPDSVADCLNLSVVVMFCNYKYPTLFSWCAKLIHRGSSPKDQWDWYYRHEENPPINEIYKPLIDRMV
jgi:hypothetical protein